MRLFYWTKKKHDKYAFVFVLAQNNTKYVLRILYCGDMKQYKIRVAHFVLF